MKRQQSAPERTTIKTSGGNGTTASYEARETSDMFTVTPSEAKPGQPVTLQWNIPDAESNSVRIEGISGEFANEASLQLVAPEAGTAFRTSNATSASTDNHVYRLDAERKGGGEPIKLEARLKILTKD